MEAAGSKPWDEDDEQDCRIHGHTTHPGAIRQIPPSEVCPRGTMQPRLDEGIKPREDADCLHVLLTRGGDCIWVAFSSG
jgi:hypothetical protein